MWILLVIVELWFSVIFFIQSLFDFKKYLILSGLKLDELQKKEMEREAAKHGLGVITAAIFLAGEMAGSGVLALPFAMIGTGQHLNSKLYYIYCTQGL